jgi:hypothetical protein
MAHALDIPTHDGNLIDAGTGGINARRLCLVALTEYENVRFESPLIVDSSSEFGPAPTRCWPHDLTRILRQRIYARESGPIRLGVWHRPPPECQVEPITGRFFRALKQNIPPRWAGCWESQIYLRKLLIL